MEYNYEMNNHSRMYEKYKNRYDNGGCTVSQLRRLTELEILTESEFEEITGEPFWVCWGLTWILII